ncbi:acyl-[ACP]--phospholipid O-acyltransferase [Azomonas macrocytogenes]|uniref:Acyl-[acyl-carrier-protein]-phospholipid O-acyltransferase/long-chain-fatty-acid--[acyl-carrier-protein] ligase n=1 Tax=Azomonas macrocytogenes TaxID=69962 RepID=A0A839SZJ0_AZOMA|nr:acyl-[ACP]--phospholipid O-acyltransferase [Azomonas macrocytogenes]MBB3102747.1 acyl-[acyl-carrier-protein]-phospholipid O-acyltransferase/long-chain-fatty-acid--[acyl-carrier-protein] ligase [Azomonas macrocytogenes]
MDKLHRMPGAWPYLIAMFINAFVDLGHKIVIQNTVFKIYDGSTQVVLTALVNGLMLLPFIILFSPAGHVSDSRSKVKVMRISAWVAVAITAVITAAYYAGWFWLAFGMTLLLAIQATFYSPAKYGYIKTLFGKPHLAEGNGLVQAVSIIAILAGTFVFTGLFEAWLAQDHETPHEMLRDVAPLGWLLVASSLVEVALLYRLQDRDTPARRERFDWRHYLRSGLGAADLKMLRKRPTIRLSIIGLATFWSVGQVLLAAFPSYGKDTLDIQSVLVIQGILASSGIGIALGSALASRWSRNRIETGLIPVGALGIAIGLWSLSLFDSPITHALNFVFIGVMGGLFIVPLNALIQFHAREDELGTILAANNWVQNVAMLGFLILTALFALAGVNSHYLLLMIAMVALVGGIYTVGKLPQSLVRFMLAQLMLRRYRVEVYGMQNLPPTGGVLLLGNHISWVDWAMVQIACPRPVRFVMLKSIYDRWYLRWLLKAMNCIPINQGASAIHALEKVADLLDAGEVVCLFPEGTISRTGQLGEFRRGYERACQKAKSDLVIVPFYLRGLWGSQFSRSSGKLKELRESAWHRTVIVAFGEPLPKDTTADVVKRRIFDQTIRSWLHYVEELPSLADAWIDCVKRRPGELALADNLSKPLKAAQALAASCVMARRLRKLSPEQNIGLLLPTSSGGMLANMAGLLAGKTLVNLNYTASQEALRSALEQAEIQTIYSSRRFIGKLDQRGLPASEVLAGRRVIYLEDLREEFGKAELLLTWLAIRLLPTHMLCSLFSRAKNPRATAAILFSSGSEGTPKGVVLSHRNIMANLKQTSDVLNTEYQDVVMASLPLFHAFGLTVTQFLPLIEGLPVVCHPDPTDVFGIARSIATYRATIMCGTSTFLRLFVRNKKIEPLMLESIRVVVAGAEKMDSEVRESFKLRFNKNIYEGYGATETAPVASVNLPDALDVTYLQVQRGGKIGTVGMPLPGTSLKIVDPDSFAELKTGEDGMILVGGPQVMQGYLHDPERTAKVIHELDGLRWYITGDKGHLDEDGFLTIIDRYSRFAKIGGEMIGLGQVEEAVKQAIGDAQVAIMAVNVPDEKKGERIVLLHDQPLDSSELKRKLQAAGCNPLMIPAAWLQVEELPRLGSGKADIATAKKLAAEGAKTVSPEG